MPADDQPATASAARTGAWSWAVPTFPHEPTDLDQDVLEVEDAYLSAVRFGDLRTLQTPTRWMTGAVHDADGVLVPASQKIGGFMGHQGAPADPRRVRTRNADTRLEGTWLYAGNWIPHFGHFILETITTLWPEGLDVDGLVLHRYFGKRSPVADWQLDLLARAGYGGLPVEIVDKDAVRVERLLVPSRGVVVNGWATPGARTVWDRVAATVPRRADSPARVFLSRTAFNARERAEGRPVRTRAQRDERLDAVFAAAGFAVVAPESLPVTDQIALCAGAEVLAGSAGTALHLSAFAPSSTRVIELGDSRSPTVQVPLQRVVDAVREHPSVYVPHAVTAVQVGEALTQLI